MRRAFPLTYYNPTAICDTLPLILDAITTVRAILITLTPCLKPLISLITSYHISFTEHLNATLHLIKVLLSLLMSMD